MTQEDIIMANAPLTPSEDAEPEPTSPVIDYSPATVSYDETFENLLMTAILSSPLETPRTPLESIPIVNPTTLPIPLASSMRTYPSPIPGVLLTHKNGYHTGGPGPSPTTMAEFARKFVEEEGIVDEESLQRAVEKAIAEKLEIARERMTKRQEAVSKNKAVERELEDLKAQRGLELAVAEKIKGVKR